jgi:hypothetical protein
MTLRPGGGRRRGVFRRYSVEEDVDREIRSHLDLLTDELVEKGWDPAEARNEALRRFGDRNAVARQAASVR